MCFRGRLSIDGSLMRWPNIIATDAVPKSVCSDPCGPGQRKKSRALNQCCWICIRCAPHERLEGETECIECPNGSYPDVNQTTCEQLPIQYMTMSSYWAIVPVVFSSCGILLTIFVSIVFIRYNKTPVIMASGRELSFMLLGGILMCYLMTFVMVAKPSVLACAVLRMGLGLSLSVCYASLFTRTNRISRIFNRGVKAMVKRPSYTSPKSQVIIVCCLVSIQVIATVTWLGMEVPATTVVFPDRRTAVLRCKATNGAVVLSLLYNMILILLCTIYAFKTRKIPENFNEAKYIAFTMYSTCIVWLAIIPIYFGTKSDFKVSNTLSYDDNNEDDY